MRAGRAVNASLTVRNWLIGASIRAYQLRGKDRALYGDALFETIASRLTDAGVRGCQVRELYRHTRFAEVYPDILGTSSPEFAPELTRFVPQLPLPAGTVAEDGPSAKRARSPKPILGTPSPELKTPSAILLERLSYSHFLELLDVDDATARAFYEAECLRGNWSVRELARQIGSLYYERSGLSRNKKKSSALAHLGAERMDPQWFVRDPYVFEFLGLKTKEVFSEADLEDALLDRLQEFILELGHGFCFEARQQRLPLGGTASSSSGVVDLVFYHRILKCHVLLELKVAAFRHEHVGQLNTYLSFYKRNIMRPGDNPPIGILLCTKKDQTVVEYALADLPNRLFVSKYQVELPKKEAIQRFLQQQVREVVRDAAGGRRRRP